MSIKDNNNDHLSHLSVSAKEDYDLISKALSGDQSAYEQLLKKYKVALTNSIIRIVKNKELAEDIVIETFGKAFARLHEYNSKFAFSTWLFRIGINKAIDTLRNKKRFTTSSIDEHLSEDSETTFAEYLVSPNDDPVQDLLKQEKIDFVKLLLDKLLPRYKRVIELYYYQDMSCEEIAKELNTNSNTIKAELFRARKILYKIILSMKHEE